MKTWKAPYGARVESVLTKNGEPISPGQKIAVITPTLTERLTVSPELGNLMRQTLASPIAGFAFIYPGIIAGAKIGLGARMFSVCSGEEIKELLSGDAAHRK